MLGVRVQVCFLRVSAVSPVHLTRFFIDTYKQLTFYFCPCFFSTSIFDYRSLLFFRSQVQEDSGNTVSGRTEDLSSLLHCGLCYQQKTRRHEVMFRLSLFIVFLPAHLLCRCMIPQSISASSLSVPTSLHSAKVFFHGSGTSVLCFYFTPCSSAVNFFKPLKTPP